MADVEKNNHEVDARGLNSDHDVRKGSITEAADIYGSAEAAEGKSNRSQWMVIQGL